MMNDAAESLGTAPEPRNNAGAPQYPRKGIGPLRKALAAVVVGAFLLGGTACASDGFRENSVVAGASQIHDSHASGGPMSGHMGTSKGGLGADAVKSAAAVPAGRKEPANVPVATQRDTGESIGTVSIPKFGADWKHYLVEGTADQQLNLPGTDDPNAVQNYETAIGHATKTQEIGEIGNTVIEAHRTQNTFGPINTLEIGDTVSITEAKTGTVYTYAVFQTMKELPFKTAPEQDYAWSAMDPIPFDDASISTPGHPAKNQPTKRLLTLTSCGAAFATTHDVRVYVQAELQSVTAGKAGA